MVLDRTPGGGWVPGGPSLYAARQALALGCRVTLYSRLQPGYPGDVLAGLEIMGPAASRVPRYANTYDAGGARTQLLLDPGEPLHLQPGQLPAADITVVAPAYRELRGDELFPGRLVSVHLQGLLRSRDRSHRVYPARDAWRRVRPAVQAGRWFFFSIEDTSEPEALAARLAGAGAEVVLTRAHLGATWFSGERRVAIAPFAARSVDPTGAGDCFATAMLIALAEGATPEEAGRVAAAAGSLAVEAPGLDGVPTRAMVNARLERVAA